MTDTDVRAARVGDSDVVVQGADWRVLVAAMLHFSWLDGVGALTREEAEHVAVFERILQEYPRAGD